jgi:hemerythrin
MRPDQTSKIQGWNIIMFVEWDNSFSINIDELDRHHKKLIDLLNKSYLLIMQEAGQEELSHLLDELIEYAQYHFAAEEDLMRLHHYQNLDQHLVWHFGFINKVLSFRKEMNEGKGYLAIDIFDFIRNWLLDHILRIDSEMGKAITATSSTGKL